VSANVRYRYTLSPHNEKCRNRVKLCLILARLPECLRLFPFTRGIAMRGQRVGYIRVSSIDQNADRQLDGVELDRKFVDHASGKDTHRPELEKMLGFVREGDTVIVHSMDRLARNLDDLRRTVQQLTKRGVSVQFVKENLAFTGSDAPMSVLLLNMLGSYAEFERSLIRERQAEGIALAKARGAYTGRRKSLNEGQVAKLIGDVAAGIPKAKVARALGISRETVYQYLLKK
jgi:DNA invertase Pin-like site-specific DNA recombinase